MKTSVALFTGALICALAVPTAASAALETISVSGTLNYGNNSSGPFGGTNSSLAGKTYSVSLTYDPSQFVSSSYSVNSCGPMPNNSCSYTLSTSRAFTETLTIGTVTKTYTYTNGSFQFTAGGSDNANFNFSDTAGDNFSLYVQDGTSFFPNQSNVNNPVFSNFSNLALQTGTLNQSGPGYSFGSNPTSLTATNQVAAAPEPATWALMVLGFGAVGFAMRRGVRRSDARFNEKIRRVTAGEAVA